jgi:hypothetical protein
MHFQIMKHSLYERTEHRLCAVPAEHSSYITVAVANIHGVQLPPHVDSQGHYQLGLALFGCCGQKQNLAPR